ncbi:MAG: ABC transporter ATP-binding protein [Kiritimatiellia bacterium]
MDRIWFIEGTMLIEAKDIYKQYRMRGHVIPVLQGLQCRVAAGESLAITGKSGAGKSTLLHILGGLDRPDRQSGPVCVAGEDLYGVSGAKRTRLRAQKIGFVFQSYHLLPELDVLDNVMLPARALGKGRKEMRIRALGLLESVGMAQRADHTPVELSGGEQQRVAIARALMNDPRVILADEPTGNLDDETGAQVLELLFGLVHKHAYALVIVTHNEQVASSCNRHQHLANGILGKTEA